MTVCRTVQINSAPTVSDSLECAPATDGAEGPAYPGQAGAYGAYPEAHIMILLGLGELALALCFVVFFKYFLLNCH